MKASGQKSAVADVRIFEVPISVNPRLGAG
jgi:hypothetical protein